MCLIFNKKENKRNNILSYLLITNTFTFTLHYITFTFTFTLHYIYIYIKCLKCAKKHEPEIPKLLVSVVVRLAHTPITSVDRKIHSSLSVACGT